MNDVVIAQNSFTCDWFFKNAGTSHWIKMMTAENDVVLTINLKIRFIRNGGTAEAMREEIKTNKEPISEIKMSIGKRANTFSYNQTK